MQQLKDFILIERNVLSIELCQKILSEYVGSTEWQNGQVGEHSSINKNRRDVSLIDISHTDVITKNIETRAYIDRELFRCAGEVLRKYLDTYEYAYVEKDSGYTLLRYNEKQFYASHTDDMISNPRTLSCSFTINEDYYGGEWDFFDGGYVTKLNAGDAIMFPANFLFPHAIRPVTSGTRYSIITWFR